MGDQVQRGSLEAQLLSAVGDALIATDVAGRVVYMNRASEVLYGWPRERIEGRPLLDVIMPAQDRERANVLMQRVLAGESCSGEFVLRRSSGGTFSAYVASTQWNDEDGSPGGIIIMSRDITIEREYERAQRESRRFSRAVRDAIPDLVFRLSREGVYLSVRAADVSALAADPIQLLGRNISEYLPHDVTELYLQAGEEALRSGRVQTCEYSLVVPTGGRREFEARIARCAEDEVIAVVRDVTERVRAENAARENRERLELAMESARMGTWDLDAQTGCVVWSQGMHEFFLASPEDFDGRFETFLEHVHPEDRDALSNFDTAEESFSREFRIIRTDGEVRWLQTRGRAYRDAAGRALRIVGVSIDVTDRKLYEQGLIEAKETAEEMASLKASFLANMSHEIRTPLASIIGFSDLLMQETSGEQYEMARLVRSASDRLMMTLDSVLALAHLESGSVRLNPVEVDLVAMVDDLLPTFRAEAAARGLYLRLQKSISVLPARVDVWALGRVLKNILTNAFKFTERGGVDVCIEREAGRATISVSDTGIGIDERFQRRLFDEFAQESQGLSRSHEGVGLGLTITRRLVDLMHGEISVQSRKGEGTTFTISLPLGPGGTSSPPAESSARPD